MYKHQSVRSIRESWQEGVNDDESKASPLLKHSVSRRSSEPITIFSAFESEAASASRGILPKHIGGVFTGSGGHGSAGQTNTIAEAKVTDAIRKHAQSESETMTSLGSALDEVLESVDEAAELHQRARSNSRIQDWLGHQSELYTQRRSTSAEEQKRIKVLTERIMRDLLGVDKSVLDILFRAKTSDSDRDSRTAKEVEMRIWKRWIELTQRDTASLTPDHAAKVSTSVPARSSQADRVRSPTARGTAGLEKIPWGVPEDRKDDEYWEEPISIPMIFRYLKSCIKSKSRSREETQTQDNDLRAAKVAKTTASTSTQTVADTDATTTTNASTINVPIKPPSPTALSHQALSRASRVTRRSQAGASRSRTSKSSSLYTLSLRTGTCSVASLRRSALGSNFWDLGSLGGISVNSREVGNWSVYV